MTAWQALFDEASLMPGQTVLIQGAAGGVGHLAVQFAKWKGASVIGTAWPASIEFVKSLGADQVLDYSAAYPFERDLDQLAGIVDAVVDCVGGESQLRLVQTLKPGGVLVALAGVTPQARAEAEGAGVRVAMSATQRDSLRLAEIGRLIDKGNLKPHIEQVFPLSQAAEAHRVAEAGHVKGKLILEVAAYTAGED
jgi:NADPH:quinone reductase-like Zn-dependent oxidoreductase